MSLAARPYRQPADLARMRQVLIEIAQANAGASYMHPGYLDFVTHYPPDEAARQRNLCLWEQPGGAVAGWAIFDPHEASFDLFAHPAVQGTPVHAQLVQAFVPWAEALARAAGLDRLAPFWAMETDQPLAGLLRAHGYAITPTHPAPPLYERALGAALPSPPLPEGFTVQTVRSEADGRQRAAVSHSAFQPNADWDAYWDTYRRFMASPVYNGELDLYVRAPDGRGAAACTLWLDEVNRVGLFEPVVTHRHFQRRGLGKAVMAEGLRRLRAAGMQRAALGFDPNNAAALALYTSLGFQPAAYFLVAHKPVAPLAAAAGR